jgi:MFS family permease
MNGASEALLYDWLAASGNTKHYAKYQGSTFALFLVGTGIANLASGFLANAVGLRTTYVLSIIPALMAIAVVLLIVEPAIKPQQRDIWYKHLRQIVAGIVQHRKLLLYSLRYIVAEITVLTIGEFGQIYILAFGVSAVMLGVFWAIDSAFAAGGRTLAHRAQSRPGLFIVVYCLVLALFISVTHSFGIGLFWLAYGLNEALANIAETEIQHETKTAVRATTLSVIGFAGNALAIPIVLLYTVYYTHHGILAANKLLGIGIIAILLLTLLAGLDRKSKLWL